jgi:hypothetical protein
MACRRWHLVQCGSLAFATSVVDAPHRIETPARLLYRGIPVRAVRAVPVDPKIDLDVSGLLSWGSSIAPPSTQPSCVVTRLGRRPDFGPGLPRPDRVPLLPFLPASAVCYAASRSGDPLVRRSAGLLHPAADHGVRHVSDSLTRPRSRASDPKVVDPKVHPEVFPCGEDPSKRSPPRQPSTMPSPRLVLSDAVAFTGWRSLSPFEPPPLACRHAALRCSRPQGFLPPRSPLRSCDVAVARPLDAPLGFGSTRFRRCRAHRAAQLSLDVSPGGPNRFGVPRPERRGKAGCFGPVWLHATDVRSSPKGPPCAIAVAPAVPEGIASAASPTGHEGDASGSAPRGGPPRRSDTRRRAVADVIATHLRRDSFATQRSLRRAAAGGSSSFSPSFRGCPRT